MHECGLTKPNLCRKDDLLTPAKTWEANGEYTRAIQAYLKMTLMQTTDYALLEEVQPQHPFFSMLAFLLL